MDWKSASTYQQCRPGKIIVNAAGGVAGGSGSLALSGESDRTDSTREDTAPVVESDNAYNTHARADARSEHTVDEARASMAKITLY